MVSFSSVLVNCCVLMYDFIVPTNKRQQDSFGARSLLEIYISLPVLVRVSVARVHEINVDSLVRSVTWVNMRRSNPRCSEAVTTIDNLHGIVLPIFSNTSVSSESFLEHETRLTQDDAGD